MAWLTRYDAVAVRRDFRRIAANGLDTVRIFLRWEDLQPAPSRIDRVALAEVIGRRRCGGGGGRAQPIVTILTGHMSGVNWIPAWATGGADGDQRFRVLSGGTIQPGRRVLRNWYSDPEIVDAQVRLATTVSKRPSPGIRPCGRGTSATRTRTAPSRPTRRRPNAGWTG